MRVVNPDATFRWMTDKPLQAIESAGRTCYKSEKLITETSAEAFVKMLLGRRHDGMVEHACMSYKIICSRGVANAIVRHRIFSFAQESTQYCNYGKTGDVEFILPLGIREAHRAGWTRLAQQSEALYLAMVRDGEKPETARDALLISLKTEMVITGNFREWRHFFKMRCDAGDQAQIRYIAQLILADIRGRVPIVFDDTDWKAEG